MPTDDEVLEVLVGKAREQMEKAVRAQLRANEFADDIGKSPPFEIEESDTKAAGRMAIRADQFADTPTPSTAARQFLELRKAAGAQPFDQIFDALRRGGFRFQGNGVEGWQANLKIALGRDRLIRRLPNGTYGLWVWYPNVRREDDEPRAATGKGSAPPPPDYKGDSKDDE